MSKRDKDISKLVAFYYFWIFANIILWSVSSGVNEDSFWPFGRHTLLSSYNITEFLFYVIGPFVGYKIYGILIEESN
ncbi:MAG TPA: hypothetical protein VLZ75_08985 [Chitinophagales bacterium]|nr:hypothetical protein [Chitinophagales bacterium]